jgi:1,4-dihydroxy-2-naphthoate octaprenyltransferase
VTLQELRRQSNIWFLAARPRTLPAAAAPVILGTAMAWADGVFHFPAALAALLGALLIQIGSNYANDYYDCLKGADQGERLGPIRATQAGWVSPRQMFLATGIVFFGAALPGAYLVWRGGMPILIIGLLSILFAILYTGGPWPLGYLGIADLFVLVFFGPVATGGTYYVQAQSFSGPAALAGLSTGLLSMAILSVNNLRDYAQDKESGKKTPAVRFGVAFVKWEYALCLYSALIVIPLLLVYLKPEIWPSLTILLLCLPAKRLIRKVWREEGPLLNLRLADTGKLLLAFSLIFSLLWILSCQGVFS